MCCTDAREPHHRDRAAMFATLVYLLTLETDVTKRVYGVTQLSPTAAGASAYRLPARLFKDNKWMYVFCDAASRLVKKTCLGSVEMPVGRIAAPTESVAVLVSINCAAPACLTAEAKWCSIVTAKGHEQHLTLTAYSAAQQRSPSSRPAASVRRKDGLLTLLPFI